MAKPGLVDQEHRGQHAGLHLGEPHQRLEHRAQVLAPRDALQHLVLDLLEGRCLLALALVGFERQRQAAVLLPQRLEVRGRISRNHRWLVHLVYCVSRNIS
ncbi:hypothetical protein D3C72_1566510 [compost metagenome]